MQLTISYTFHYQLDNFSDFLVYFDMFATVLYFTFFVIELCTASVPVLFVGDMHVTLHVITSF